MTTPTPIRYVVIEGTVCDVSATGFDDSVVPLYVSAKHYDALKADLAAAQSALERERIRLAACGVVAMANTPESAAQARQMHEDYRSASLSDVERAVDAEMKLRADLAAAQEALAIATRERNDAIRASLTDLGRAQAAEDQVERLLLDSEGAHAAITALKDDLQRAEERAERNARDAAMLAFIFECFEINADSFKWRGTGNVEKLRQELIDISGVDAAIASGEGK